FSFCMMAPITVHAPYLDRDLFEFLISLPADLTVTKSLHDETIETAFPSYRFPYEDKHAPRDRSSLAHYHRWVRDIVHYAAMHRQSRLIDMKSMLPRWCASLIWPWQVGSTDWYFDPATYLMCLEAVAEGSLGIKTPSAWWHV